MDVVKAAMTLHRRQFATSSWNIAAKQSALAPFTKLDLPTHGRSVPDCGRFQGEQSSTTFDRHPSTLVHAVSKNAESGPSAGSRFDVGQPRANVDLMDIQAQAVLLEEQSKQDHEESQKLTGQYLRQMCDNKSVRVTHACEHCRQRKAKCSGLQPCTRCTKQNRLCTFSKIERKKKLVGSLHEIVGPHYAPMTDMQSYQNLMVLHRPQTSTSAMSLRNRPHRRMDAGAPYIYPRGEVADSVSMSNTSTYEGSLDDQTSRSFQPRPMQRYLETSVGLNPVSSGSWTASLDDHNAVHASASFQYSSAMPGSPSPSLSSNLVASVPASPNMSHTSLPGLDSDDTLKRTAINMPSLQYRVPFPNIPTPSASYSAPGLKKSSLSQVWGNSPDPKEFLNASWQ